MNKSVGTARTNRLNVNVSFLGDAYSCSMGFVPMDATPIDSGSRVLVCGFT